LSNPTFAADVPAAASAPSIWVWHHAAMFGSSASTTAAACRVGVA
jgi:hypothetical protein